jgi:hypothetical protein
MNKSEIENAIENLEVTPFTRKGKLREISKQSGWALCVGAGLSLPFFPDWNTLATNILAKNTLYSRSDAEKLVKEFGPAAAFEIEYGDKKSDPEFYKTLSDMLYENFQSKFSDRDWNDIISLGLSAASPKLMSNEKWGKFVKLLKEGEVENPSLFTVAECIAKCAGTEHQPEAIVSFNAETLLYSLINAYFAHEKAHEKPLIRMVHDLSQRKSGHIPYYFIHGLASIPGKSRRLTKLISSDRMVFSESAYLNLSNQNYSWQSSNFLSVVQNYRCVFIGVSFTDPNLRRWLAWQNQGKAKARKSKNIEASGLYHYWFKKRDKKRCDSKSTYQKLVEKSVRHLGVRVIWIDDYSEIGKILANMLAEKTSDNIK